MLLRTIESYLNFLSIELIETVCKKGGVDEVALELRAAAI